MTDDELGELRVGDWVRLADEKGSIAIIDSPARKLDGGLTVRVLQMTLIAGSQQTSITPRLASQVQERVEPNTR